MGEARRHESKETYSFWLRVLMLLVRTIMFAVYWLINVGSVSSTSLIQERSLETYSSQKSLFFAMNIFQKQLAFFRSL